MIIHKKSFRGGYRFRNFRGEPSVSTEILDAPKQVYIPLKRKSGDEVLPLVETGDTVKKGQMIGRSDNTLSSPIHTSISGTVSDLKKREISGEPVTVAVIDRESTAGDGEYLPVKGATKEWQNLTPEKIEEILYLSGASGLGSGLPTRWGSCEIAAEDVDHIIISSADNDLFQPSPDALFQGEGFSFFSAGIGILKKVYSRADITITIREDSKKLAFMLRDNQELQDATLVLNKPKYPQDREEVLVPTILGGDYPYGFSAVRTGVLVLSFQTVLHLADAVTLGKPVIHRTVSLGGESFSDNGHLNVPVGTTLEEILSGRLTPGNHRIVLDSLNSGSAVEDLSTPVLWDTRAVIAIPEGNEGEMLGFAMPGFVKDSISNTMAARFLPLKKKLSTNIHGEQRACIQCGFCIDVCPVRILPNLLYRYVDRGIIEDSLASFKIFDCIHCNLCTYVCTSKLPLAETIKNGQEKLKEEGIDPAPDIARRFDLKGQA